MAILPELLSDAAAASRRKLTRARTRLRGRTIPLVHDRSYRQLLSSVPLDAMRGERILAFLIDRGWASPGDVVPPGRISLEPIHRVHSPAYVRSLEDPEAIGEILGLPVDEDQARAAVRLQRLMVGGTLEGARRAMERQGTVVHLGGGLHHAGSARGRGFCIFNDVAVAIHDLRALGFRQPTFVVDLDIHDGDGTREIFDRDPSVHTYSVHNEAWGAEEAVASTSVALGAGVGDEAYLAALEETLPGALRRHQPGFVIYIAGADVSSEDVYGNWDVSGEGILRRDRFVVEAVRGAVGDVPILVLLGGGYGLGAWRPPARFLAWLYEGRVREPPDDVAAALGRVRWLEPAGKRVPGEDPFRWGLSEEDLGDILPGAGEEARLLGHYGAMEVEEDLERFGVLSHIRARGYSTVRVSVLPSTGLGPTLRVHGGRPAGDAVLVEARLDVDPHTIPGLKLLSVEWLLLQDPSRPFPPHRPRLPGQEHPGLGALADLVAWLVSVCEELGLDGLGFRSSHFHVAELARRHVRFLRPEDAERFQRLRRAVRDLPLPEASRAVAEGTVTDPDTGASMEWGDVPMVVPVSQALRRRLTSGAQEAPKAPRD